MNHTRESILSLLATNDHAVERALVAIWKRQTADEKRDRTTKLHNGIGFTCYDAKYLSYCAEYVSKGNSLTGKHLDKCRRKIARYVRQLLEIANSHDAKEAAEAQERARYIDVCNH